MGSGESSTVGNALAAAVQIYRILSSEKAMRNLIFERVQKLRRALEGKPIDAFMVLIDHNRRYLSGFSAEDALFDESAGALFISSDKLVLATDSRYTLQAAEEAPLYEIFCYEKGLIPSLPTLMRKLNVRSLGYEKNRLSIKQHEAMAQIFEAEQLTVALSGHEGLVENQRMIKDKTEIESTMAALAIAEKAFTQVISALHPGLTEKAVAWLLEKSMREAGAEALSFPVIVASGPNSAMPHAVPGDRKIKMGEPLLFDWGARLHGYCSDVSRTLCLGEPDARFEKVYQTVRDAQCKAIEAIRAGVHSLEIDRVARAHIDQAGFKDRFGHGLGHGVGLAVHEPPRISPLKDTILEEGMLFTVEPGVYLPAWGGVRLENMVVVRHDGAEVLNTLGLDRYALAT
jgi:Xaa-Pro aminopeptidase